MLIACFFQNTLDKCRHDLVPTFIKAQMKESQSRFSSNYLCPKPKSCKNTPTIKVSIGLNKMKLDVSWDSKSSHCSAPSSLSLLHMLFYHLVCSTNQYEATNQAEMVSGYNSLVRMEGLVQKLLKASNMVGSALLWVWPHRRCWQHLSAIIQVLEHISTKEKKKNIKTKNKEEYCKSPRKQSIS